MDKKARKARKDKKASKRAKRRFGRQRNTKLAKEATQQASPSNMQTDNEHAANMTTPEDDGSGRWGGTVRLQCQEDEKSVSVPFAHYNGRCPRRIQSRVAKANWSYKSENDPNGRRKRIETMRPQAKPVQQDTVECTEHLLALNDMKSKVIYMAA